MRIKEGVSPNTRIRRDQYEEKKERKNRNLRR